MLIVGSGINIQPILIKDVSLVVNSVITEKLDFDPTKMPKIFPGLLQ